MRETKEVNSGGKAELMDQECYGGGQSGPERGGVDWPGFFPQNRG